MTDYQICSRCIMDTTDAEISFNSEGECNYCSDALDRMKTGWVTQDDSKLSDLMTEIRDAGRNNEYDCVIGVSGGVDSSYVAYMAKQHNMRPLCIHVDAGWNSKLAVQNIENVVKNLGFDLFTYVVDWEEMRSLQVSFYKSAVSNQDIPQDHAFLAKVYEIAAQNNIKYILNGSNFATESILPSTSEYDASDKKHILSIQKIFGDRKLKTYPLISMFQLYIYYPFIKKIKLKKPLNLFKYNKSLAMNTLSEELGWQYYGGKHFESRFTKFHQSYYLPNKFGYDKRRAHLSSLIIGGELARDEAMAEMKVPSYDPKVIENDKDFISKKLGLSREEFESILQLPNKSFSDYPSNFRLYKLKNAVVRTLRSIFK